MSSVGYIDLVNFVIGGLEHLGFEYGWSVYSPSKKSEILEAERSKDELRDIMTRMVGAEIRYTKLGYWMRMPPYGYVSRRVEPAHGKRTILESDPVEANHIITAFKMLATGQYSNHETAKRLNGMGYLGHSKRGLRRSRSRPITNDQRTKLTATQLWRMIRNPIYAGISCEKWTDYKPMKCAFDGLVSIDLFNRANQGRRALIDDGEGNISLEDFESQDRSKSTKPSPEFPHKRLVLCPKCHKPLHGSASTGGGGKKYPAYHCYQWGHNFRISKEALEHRVDEFMGGLQLSPQYVDKCLEHIGTTIDKLNDQYNGQIGRFDNQILELKRELDNTIQKLKVLSSPTAIKCMEDELVRLEREVAGLEHQKQALKTKKPRDIKEIGQRLKHIFEHFDQAAKKLMCPVKKARLFALIFDKFPTANDLDVRTASSATLAGVNSLFLSKESGLLAPGASGGIRTPDTRFRRPLLYPG